MTDLPPVVVKIGGGLLRAAGLPGLQRACAEATQMAAHRPVLVVPGGGPFADAVRSVDANLGLSDEMAHALALRAMDQLGMLLRPLLPGAALLPRLDAAAEASAGRHRGAPGSVAILEAAPAFDGHPAVPESWAVTSDSLAVVAADAIGAGEAILLKPVPGVVERAGEPPLPALTADQLQALQRAGGAGVVDDYLPEAVRRTGVTVIVRAPGSITGTRITAG